MILEKEVWIGLEDPKGLEDPSAMQLLFYCYIGLWT